MIGVNMARPGVRPPEDSQKDGEAPAPSRGAAAGIALREAVSRGITEVLMEPVTGGVRVRWRLDGQLEPAPAGEASALWAARDSLARLARIEASNNTMLQEGYFEQAVEGTWVRFWFRSFPGAAGPAYSLDIYRLQPVRPWGLDDLGMHESELRRLREALAGSTGMIVVTGPTHSGKTVTLYAALRTLTSPSKVTMTAEHPVQERVEGAIQVECRPELGLDFQAVLYSFKPRRPQAILVQELRDRGTAELSVQAALRDSLVLTSLHTWDAPTALIRIVDMGIEPYLVAQAVRLVQTQRLLRRVCPACAAPKRLDAPTCRNLGLTEDLLLRLGLDAELLKSPRAMRGKGCPACRQTGCRGLVMICESFSMSESLRHLLLRRASFAKLQAQLRAEGMCSLREAALREVLLGTTTLDEAVLATTSGR
jgi:type II secretory ATPase GspE/PulE/Tfp pilus assembly ATPase PilB-like protein